MIDIGDRYFMCDECGLCEDWEWRLKNAQEHDYDFQFDYCWCSKIDAKFYAGGYCEDAFMDKKTSKCPFSKSIYRPWFIPVFLLSGCIMYRKKIKKV